MTSPAQNFRITDEVHARPRDEGAREKIIEGPGNHPRPDRGGHESDLAVMTPFLVILHYGLTPCST